MTGTTKIDLRMRIPSLPTKADLLRLGEHKAIGSVSIYVDLPEPRSSITAYRARLRRLVRVAESQTPLTADALRFVKEVEEFAQEPKLWLTSHSALAILASSHGMETFYLDRPVEDLATVDNHFYLKPILESLPLDRQCMVALLAADGVKLYEVTQSGISVVDEFEMPDNVSPSQRIPGVQLRSQPSGGKTRGAVFHGHASDSKEKEMSKRLRLVDDWLARHLDTAQNKPVILAGVEYLTSAFRGLSKCPGFLDHTIEGSRLSQQDLSEGALKILQEVREAEFVAASERYDSLAGGSRVATKYHDILRAAKDGRVDTAFVASDRNQWMLGSRMGFREDVFDRIGVETLMTQGEVFVVPESRIPSGEGACAILRY